MYSKFLLSFAFLFCGTNFIYGQSMGLDWVHQIGNGEGGIDQPEDLFIDHLGNYYVTGFFEGSVDFDPSPSAIGKLTSNGEADAFVAKYDLNGNYIWAISIGGEYTEQGNSVTVDDNGNVYVTGFYEDLCDFNPSDSLEVLTPIGYKDIFLAKYDSLGNFIWVKSMGGSSHEWGSNVAIGNSNQLILTGTYQGTIDLDPSVLNYNISSIASYYDIFIAEYNLNGDFQWANSFGDSGAEYVTDLKFNDNNEFIISGTFGGTVDFDPGIGTMNLTSNGGTDCYIAKYDSLGSLLMAINVGGSGYEEGSKFAFDSSDNIYFTGMFVGTADFDPSGGVSNISTNGGQDGFLAKYDSQGLYQWAFTIGASLNQWGIGVTVDGNDNPCVTGFFESTVDFDPSTNTEYETSQGGEDMFIASYNANGEYLWSHGVGGIGTTRGLCMETNPAGDVCVTGYNYWTADFDPSFPGGELTSVSANSVFIGIYESFSGNYLNGWITEDQKGGVDEVNDIVTDSAGNLYVAGRVSGNVDFDGSEGYYIIEGNGTYDAFLAKYDPLGNLIWVNTFGAQYDDEVHGLAIDDSVLYIVGNFQDSVDFDSSLGTAILGSHNGNSDIFLAKYDTSGQYIWAIDIGGNGSDYGRAVGVDSNGDVYITGDFKVTTDFDPSVSSALVTTNGTADVFLAKYDNFGNYIWAKGIGGLWFDRSNDIAVDANDNIFITGWFSDSANFDSLDVNDYVLAEGVHDVFLAKYSANGSCEWVNGIGSIGVQNKAYSVAIDVNNNAYITGQMQGTVDFDPTMSVANITASGSAFDMFLAKYNENGEYVWAFGVGDDYSAIGSSLTIDNNQDLYVTGSFGNTVDFDPSLNTANLTAFGQSDIYVAKYDTSSNYIWSTSMGGAKDEQGTALTVHEGAQLFLGGLFYSMADFNPSNNMEYYLNSDGLHDIFLGVYNQCFPSNATLNDTVCDNVVSPSGAYVWDSTGVYSDLISNNLGCDSLITVNLLVQNSSAHTDIVSACNSYQWLDGNTYAFDNNTAMHILTNSVGCDSVLTLNLDINNIDTSVIQNGIDLTANAFGPGFNYQWIDCNDNYSIISGETSQSYSTSQSGNYALIISDGFCTDTSNCYFVDFSRIEKMNATPEINLYPNPTSGEIFVDIGQNVGDVKLLVRNALGQVINSMDYVSTKILNYEISGSPGIYFIEISINETPQVVLRAVKT